MSTIKVNHKTLREVAEAIDKYCGAQNREMRAADIDIKAMLIADWIGLDAKEFREKWEGVDKKDSVTIKFRDALRALSDNLIACADEYRKAQAETYNAAFWLDKTIPW